MSSEQSRIELVESSFEKIKPQANEFVASFYQNLFEAYPESQPLFAKTDMKKQEQKLLNSLVLLVESLRQPEILKPVLRDLGARHKGYGALPEYYPAVGQAILTTFEQYLQQEWTAEVQQAWVDTYDVITQIMLEGAGATVAAETVKLTPSQSPVQTPPVVENEPQVEPEIQPEVILTKTRVETPAIIQLSAESRIELVESSFEKIKPQANEFVASFYQNLFEAYPESQPLFAKTDMKKQEQKLLNSLVLLVESLRQPEILKPVLRDLGARHKGYGALPEYYPAVGQTLLKTFEQYIPQDWTAEVQQAWVDTYDVITQIMLEGAGANVAAETVKLTPSQSPVQTPPVVENEPQVEPEIQPEVILTKTRVETPAIIQLSAESRIELVESSFEKIKPQANEFVASFYQNLFEAYPESQPLFAKTDMKKQEQKLLNSLVLLVESLRQPEILKPVLRDLGARHKGYGALPEYYPAVGQAILTTFEQYLQQEWTAEVQQAWVDTYDVITQIMLEGAGANVAAETVKFVAEKSELQTENSPAKSSDQLRIERVESSFEKIKPRANEFVTSFYQNLFTAYPETEPLFEKTDIKKQEQKLLNSLVLLVENLRKPEVLKPVLRDLGARHKGYGTLPEYYPAVGQTLLKTFEQYLQQEWTAEVQQAWVDTYDVITQLMLEGAEKVSTPVQPENQVTPEKAAKPKKKFKLPQFSKFRSNLTNFLQPRQQFSKLKERLNITVKQAANLFWELPTIGVVVGSATVLLILITLVEENDNSFLAKLIDQLETVSILIALILYVKEIPDRRKEFHYQAWSIIDASKDVKVSYARILALQDLNEDSVPLRGLEANNADLTAINLPNADLGSSNFTNAILKESNLSRANFDKALLARADLSGANLSYANFSFAKLSYVNFSLANLSHANLICADLRQAQLTGADLSSAQLSGANLDGVYLTGANLKGAQVSEFDLRGAYLKGAIMPDGSKHP